MSLDNHWFSEAHVGCGSAFSLKITEKLHEETTPFQKIEVYATEEFGNMMAIDGFFMLSQRDNFLYHEMMSHPALFIHPNPRRVVVIGGGDCGTMREVLKHPGVEHVLQVEIDEQVTRLSEKYFPELCESNNDPRAELFFGDGIRWMKEAEAGSVDLVIIDSTDPVGPAEGLFSEPFYRDCIRALGEDGMLVQQSEAPLYHLDSIIKPMHEGMRRAGFADTRTLHFPQPVYPSGWWTATLTSKKAGVLDNFRQADAEQKGFETLYYSADMHKASFVLPPFMQKVLA